MELIQPFTDAIAKSLDENLDRTKIQLNFAKLMDTPASEELLSLALRKQLSHRTLSDTFRLFDLALDLESLKLCDSGLAVILIEEASEALILSQLPELFQYLDRKQVEITANMTPQKGKGLVLLRICNELLRRLSKHDRLCGNIRLFLSKAFPLCDRSGVNFRGDYHTDNITVYDTQEPNTLYQCFWRLQMDFSHMPAADPRKTLQNPLDRKRWHSEAYVGGSLKYLTSPALFEMELASSSFRRQFLFQVLFYLQSIENDDKVLSKRILGLLDNCGSKYLTEALEDVIRHENNWIRWKKSGCKSYELPPISTQAKPMVQPTTRAGDAKNYGTEALSALFANSPKPTKRKRLDDLIVELDYQYNDDMSFAEGVEQEFLPTNDPKYNWQLYRLCVAEHLEYLEGDLDPTALLAAWRKHRKSSV